MESGDSGSGDAMSCDDDDVDCTVGDCCLGCLITTGGSGDGCLGVGDIKGDVT